MTKQKACFIVNILIPNFYPYKTYIVNIVNFVNILTQLSTQIKTLNGFFLHVHIYHCFLYFHVLKILKPFFLFLFTIEIEICFSFYMFSNIHVINLRLQLVFISLGYYFLNYSKMCSISLFHIMYIT